jgi:hypothetical protein
MTVTPCSAGSRRARRRAGGPRARRERGDRKQGDAGQREGDAIRGRARNPPAGQEAFAIVVRRSRGRCAHPRPPRGRSAPDDGFLDHIARRARLSSDVRAGPRGPLFLVVTEEKRTSRYAT